MIPFFVALLIGGTIAAGMATTITAITLVGAMSGLAIALIRPHIGLLVVAFVAPLNPTTVIPAPGLNIALVGAILIGLVFRLPIDRPRIRLHPALLLLTAYVAFIVVQLFPEISTGFAGDRARYVGFLFFQVASALGLVWASLTILAGRSPLPYIAMLFIAATLGSVVAIALALDPAITGLLGTLVADPDVVGGRATGIFGNPNYFGAFLASVLSCAVAIVPVIARRWQVAMVPFIAVLGVALLLSLSRGGIVAFFVGILVLAATRGRRYAAGVLLAGAIIGAIAYPLFLDQRLSVTNGAGASHAIVAQSDAGRLSAVLAGPSLFLTSPLVGVRFGQYSELTGISAHNWYMNTAGEQGIVGLLLWIAFLAGLTRELRRRPPRVARIGLAVLGSFVTSGMFTNNAGSYQTVAFVVITLCAVLVADWGAASRPTEPTSRGSGASDPIPQRAGQQGRP